MSERAYPLPRPESGNDPRFTYGLSINVKRALEAAGYPPITAGSDIVELQLALFRFLYKPLNAEELAAVDSRLDEDQPAPPARGHGQDNPDDADDNGIGQYTDAQLSGDACSVCAVDFVYGDVALPAGHDLDGGDLMVDDGSLRAHPDCLAAFISTEPQDADAGLLQTALPDDADGNGSGRYTDAQLAGTACAGCGFDLATDEVMVLADFAAGRPLFTHAECLGESTTTEPPGDAP